MLAPRTALHVLGTLLVFACGPQPPPESAAAPAPEAAPEPAAAPEPNWLPTPAGQNFNLTFRFYAPGERVISGGYFPPPLVKKN